MPIQEIYLEQGAGLNHFQVIKSYDAALAKEAFSGMDEDALHTWATRQLNHRAISFGGIKSAN